ncbi:hypothetical protein BDA96_07G151800 [Sorghum bicolor]|uniref:Uncharacterized protein n=2 Tax=Sorghum bicolor TaxID=4558 RepID=A0A921QMY2_SORBI|nr:hypothetical protein BDA96_07G151800 [Sorghum bicolor]OQU80534.1 hypothetical protein SORBI_3007G141001 [Sorghum bicolor]
MAYSLSVSLLRVLASCRPLNEWISWCGFMCDGIAGVRRDRESVQDKAGHRSIWAGVSSLSCTTTTTAARPTTSLPPRTGRLCVSAVVQLVPYFGASGAIISCAAGRFFGAAMVVLAPPGGRSACPEEERSVSAPAFQIWKLQFLLTSPKSGSPMQFLLHKKTLD